MSAVGLSVSRRGSRGGRALVFGGALTAGALIVAFIVSNVVAFMGQRSLEARWEAALARPAAHANPHPGDPVARIRVPIAGLDAIVVEGGAGSSHAPVHLLRTALPGLPGLAAIEAGRLGFGSFFAQIDRLQPGDDIVVQSLQGIVLYRVTGVQRLDARDVDLTSGGDATLLVLMAPASRLGSDERIVVRARAIRESRT
jgi:sortase (surface protein transpeptidase)